MFYIWVIRWLVGSISVVRLGNQGSPNNPIFLQEQGDIFLDYRCWVILGISQAYLVPYLGHIWNLSETCLEHIISLVDSFYYLMKYNKQHYYLIYQVFYKLAWLGQHIQKFKFMLQSSWTIICNMTVQYRKTIPVHTVHCVHSQFLCVPDPLYTSVSL